MSARPVSYQRVRFLRPFVQGGMAPQQLRREVAARLGQALARQSRPARGVSRPPYSAPTAARGPSDPRCPGGGSRLPLRPEMRWTRILRLIQLRNLAICRNNARNISRRGDQSALKSPRPLARPSRRTADSAKDNSGPGWRSRAAHGIRPRASVLHVIAERRFVRSDGKWMRQPLLPCRSWGRPAEWPSRQSFP